MVVLKLLSVPIISTWTMGQRLTPQLPQGLGGGELVWSQFPARSNPLMARHTAMVEQLATGRHQVGCDPASSQKQAWTQTWRIEKFTQKSHGFETNLPLNPFWGSCVGRVKSVDRVAAISPSVPKKNQPKAHLSGKASEHRAYSGSFHDSRVGYINLPQQVYTSRFHTLTVSQYSSSTICLPKKMSQRLKPMTRYQWILWWWLGVQKIPDTLW